MPANYAHYRFGAQLLKILPADARRTVNRHRALYDMGLHGPDIFFYYDPARKNAISDMGHRLHHQSGQEVFARICKRHRLEPSEPARAYLYGLLAHYCLDSVCHPFVHRHTDEGPLNHTELEMEFERYLLDLDGKRPPCAQDCSRHMALTDAECAVIAELYPNVTAKQVAQSVRKMASVTRLLATPPGPARKLLLTGSKYLAKDFFHFFMHEEPNPACAHLIPELMSLYSQAFRRYPELLRQITANLTCSVPLGEEFSPDFG